MMDYDFETIKALERELTLGASRTNAARLSELLSEDFEEVGVSGETFTKADILETLPGQKVQKMELSDFSFERISDSEVKLTYVSVANNTKVNRCSVWVKNANNEWQMRSHTGKSITS